MGTPNSVIQLPQKIQNFDTRLIFLALCHHHSACWRSTNTTYKCKTHGFQFYTFSCFWPHIWNSDSGSDSLVTKFYNKENVSKAVSMQT